MPTTDGWTTLENRAQVFNGVTALRRLARIAIALVFIAGLVPAVPAQEPLPPPMSPAEALKSFRIRPGFQIELMASEPLVTDPIAFDWAADGSLWVLEMGDYPLGLDGKGKEGGRVRILRDSDGDGRYDKATTLVQGLGFPSGLICWKRGALVACAPNILYVEDSDGDGHAELIQIPFTGFHPGNQQHRVNGFDYGLDGWIYGANGDSGGQIRSRENPNLNVSISGRDFRFDPEHRLFEPESGQTQFGRHRDDWGRWFGNNNPSWGWQYVLTERDLGRNRKAVTGSPRQVLTRETRVYPASKTLARFNEPGRANHVTSANSPTPYRDELFGDAFATSLFVSEPVHNLVRRLVLEPQGSAWIGKQPDDEAGTEFLASNDSWFRPTMLKTGPDGALWIADMYRAVIEHPEWIPPDWQKTLDLRAGSDKGRIYRVVPTGKRTRPIPSLAGLTPEQLVDALDSASGWKRDTAQRLLLEKSSPSAVAKLKDVAIQSRYPKARLQSLWTLSCLKSLDENLLLNALSDSHPQVKRAALTVGVEAARTSATLAGRFRMLADDPDPEVRLEVALRLGELDGPENAEALARIALRDKDDPWTRTAVLISADRHGPALLARLFEKSPIQGPPTGLVEALVGQVLAGGSGWDELLAQLNRPDAAGSWRFAAGALMLEQAQGRPNALSPPARDSLARLGTEAKSLALDPQAAEIDRRAALKLLAASENLRPELRELLRPQVPVAIQKGTIEALSKTSDRRVAEMLLAAWPGLTPNLRNLAVETLLSREVWTDQLLSSLEDTCVPASEIGPAHRARLLGLPSPDRVKRARLVFRDGSESRQAILDRYRQALTANGDVKRGEAAFRMRCGTCHRLGTIGVEVGPDLGALKEKADEALLIALLDPNRAFESRYVQYLVELKDGRSLSGLITSETASAITVRGQEGREEVVPRADIERMAGSGKSLMPEGLEKDLTPEQVSDLFAFLRSKR